MDIEEIVGQELVAVEFVQDFVRLRFEGPVFSLYAWPFVLLPDFSVGYGEPEYRNALCAQIGQNITKAIFDEGVALTIELENGVAFGLSLREEELDNPVAGAYSETGDLADEVEF